MKPKLTINKTAKQMGEEHSPVERHYLNEIVEILKIAHLFFDTHFKSSKSLSSTWSNASSFILESFFITNVLSIVKILCTLKKLCKGRGEEISLGCKAIVNLSFLNLLVTCINTTSPVWLIKSLEITKAGLRLIPLPSENGKSTATISPCFTSTSRSFQKVIPSVVFGAQPFFGQRRLTHASLDVSIDLCFALFRRIILLIQGMSQDACKLPSFSSSSRTPLFGGGFVYLNHYSFHSISLNDFTKQR